MVSSEPAKEKPSLPPDDAQIEGETEQKHDTGIYDWTWGLIMRLNPFARSSTDPTTECIPNAPQPIPNIESSNASNVSELGTAVSESLNLDPEPNDEAGSAEQADEAHDLENEGEADSSQLNDEADIRQLIEESRTDSEEELSELSSSDIQSEAPHSISRSRSKSSEILRLSSSHLASSMIMPERPKTIQFDDIATLLDAADEGDVEEVRRLVEERGVDVNICNETGATALHRAAGHGQVEVLEFLMGHGARLNATDSDNWTALHVACSVGSLDAVKVLLRHHANVELVTDNGETAGDLTNIADIHRHLKMAHDSKYTADQVTVLYDYEPAVGSDDEIPLKMGQVVRVIDRADPDWWRAELPDGRHGFIPRALVQ